MNNFARASAVALVAAGFAAGGWPSGDARAQTPPQVQPRPPTPEPRPGESYEPVGVRVGGFILYPQLELAEQYNTNIFATENHTVDDFITVVRPSLDLRSNWNNHMLNLSASGAFGFYASNTRENYTDYRFGFDGRVDIQRDWNVYGGASFNHLHQDRGDPDATAFASPNEYNKISANAGYYQKFNRFSVRLEGLFDDYTYLNNKGAAAGAIANADRDRSEYTETLRLGYEFIEKYEVWVQGGLNQRRYDRRVDSAGFRRSSTGWGLVGGATIDFGGITQVEAFAGYRAQNYDDSRLGDISGPIFGLAAYWNPLVPLIIKPYVKRTIEETVSTVHAGYWSTVFGVDVDYDFRPNIKITGAFSYSLLNYQKARGAVGTFGRDDDYFRVEIGLRYLPTENFFVGPAYAFTSRNSNISNGDYDRHLFTIRVGARL
jgi:hypothetical protein